MTKNITLAIDEDLLDKVRVLAALKRTSVNEMVRNFLRREVEAETGLAQKAEKWSRLFGEIDEDASNRPAANGDNRRFNRSEMYEEVMGDRSLL